MKLLVGYSVLAAIIAPSVVNAAFRGLQNDVIDVVQEKRQLMMNDNGNGNGGGGSGTAECPKMNHDSVVPDEIQCNSNSDCTTRCAASSWQNCCCVVTHASGGGYCGPRDGCNIYGQCRADPVASSSNADDTVKIYTNNNGDEIIQTKDVTVSVAKDGTETIEIASHNNVRGEGNVASVPKVQTNPTKASECPGVNKLFVKLRIDVDKSFEDHGSYFLDDDDDDDDDDDSGEYWDEDDFTEGQVINEYLCLDKFECYQFQIDGEGDAFDPDATGSAKLWVDNGDGTLRRLICLNDKNDPNAREDDDDSGDPTCPDGEFETARTWFGCDCDLYGGYSGGCPGSSDDEDDDAMTFVTPSTCQPGVLCDVGDGGVPESAFPLGTCQGDCDDDEDCDQSNGLAKCFQRDDKDPVPGCSGEGSTDTDYCVLIAEPAQTSSHHRVSSTHHHHTGN